MQALKVIIEGNFNSFRYPAEMTYQRSYYIPPKTTIIGHLGSALGLSDQNLIPLYDTIKVGVYLENFEGKTLDLWRITKLKSPKNETAVVVRELLYRPRYRFYYLPQPESRITLEDIERAFINPVYAPCLGRSDELSIYKEIKIIDIKEAPQNALYRYTILPFPYTEDPEGVLDFSQRGNLLKNLPPEISPLPIGFIMEGGGRKAKWCESTIVYGIGVRLSQKRGMKDGEVVFFTF